MREAPLDLALERFRVVADGTRFVVGREERPLALDMDRIVLLRGSVAGVAGSHALVALGARAGYARIDLGMGGGVIELRGGLLPVGGDGGLDLHRPYVDEATFACQQKDGGEMRRIEAVADVWLDSASMPFAQWHYPFENRDLVENEWYPADFILEAIDQTRGWFYTLHATAVFLGWDRAYRNVVSTGHVLDAKGKKMSKSRGNAVDPWEVLEKYGADAVRWYFYTVNQPGDPKRFDEKDVRTTLSRMVGTLTNTLTFYQTYSTRGAWKKLGGDVPEAKTALDRWILSRLQGTVQAAAERMDAYDMTEATRAIEAFVIDDLSNWYVRRSRERFQRPESKEDQLAASQLLAYVLVRVARAVAPFMPFVADEVYQAITKDGSVHLTDYPDPSAPLRDDALDDDMEATRSLVAEGLAARKAKGKGFGVRQPIGALAAGEMYEKVIENDELKQLVIEELNVKDVVSLDVGLHEDWLQAPENESVRLDPEITEELKREGQVRELFRAVQSLRKEVGLQPSDTVNLFVTGESPVIGLFVQGMQEDLSALRLKKITNGKPTGKRRLGESELDLDGSVRLVIT